MLGSLCRSVIGSSIYGANNGSGSPVSPVNRRQGTRSKWIAEPEETAGGTLAAAMAVQRRQAASPEPVDDGGFSERLKQVGPLVTQIAQLLLARCVSL